VLPEVNQAQKIKGHMFSLICRRSTEWKYKKYYDIICYAEGW
jgi:hypothetical protein